MAKKSTEAAMTAAENEEPPLSSLAAEKTDKQVSEVAVALQTNTLSDNTEANVAASEKADEESLFSRFKTIFGGRTSSHDNGNALREAIEEYIDDKKDEGTPESSIAAHEKALLSNILELRDVTVNDVMIPRADIIAVDIDTSQEDLLKLLAEQTHSRLPVYRGSLDDVVGTIHIKDILTALANGKRVVIAELARDVPIISPSMHVLDLLLMMRQMRKHMALVVDEFGGIDGLIAVGDVIEAIIGDIDDEYDKDDDPVITKSPDGSYLVDGRYDLEEFEDEFGTFLSDDEYEDVDTLGGLVFAIEGRIPARGEIIHHEDSGLVFEIVDADPRRINRIRVKNLPDKESGDTA